MRHKRRPEYIKRCRHSASRFLRISVYIVIGHMMMHFSWYSSGYLIHFLRINPETVISGAIPTIGAPIVSAAIVVSITLIERKLNEKEKKGGEKK